MQYARLIYNQPGDAGTCTPRIKSPLLRGTFLKT